MVAHWNRDSWLASATSISHAAFRTWQSSFDQFQLAAMQFTEGAAKVSIHRSMKTLTASVTSHED